MSQEARAKPSSYALIIGATLFAYLPTFANGFIWDDAGHVTRADLRGFSGLVRIWTELGATQQYYPLLHSAFWIEHRLWGDWAGGYHVLNALLHAAAACLVFRILRRLAIPGAFFSAMVFALHPVAVESVAWVSEQKNTLSAVFYLLALLAYLDWRDKRASTGKAVRAYLLASGLFICALLSKSVTATLPAALLVILAWKNRRISWKADVIPLLPWFALSAASGFLTSWMERAYIGAQGTDFALSWVQRCLLAGRALWFYAGKVLWPLDLEFVYPRWTISAGAAWQYLFPVGFIGLVGALAWTVRKSAGSKAVKNRSWGLLAGVLFFAGTLFPALGFVDVYPFLFSFVADHFQYLACLGLIVPFCACLTELSSQLPPWGAKTAAFGLLSVLAILTFRQTRMYHDLITLYETTIQANPEAWLAEENLGSALVDAGRGPEALPYFRAALRLHPGYPEGENNLGDALNHLGRAQEALAHLQEAIRLRPAFAEAHNNLGVALMMSSRPVDGMAEINRALQLKPAYPVAQFNLGLALASGGNLTAALPHFAEAVRLDPTYADAQLNWGMSLASLSRPLEAIPHFEEAVRLNPSSPQAHYNFAVVLKQVGRLQESAQEYQETRRLSPNAPPLP